ncbi:MAG: class I SAM-dependent methyltransferase [Candidatus Electrothrix sp. ATG2]|nr:class I SAM-dependent methyltransferase [Candidatus Electrothrix sp. ATG2]
MDRFFPYFIREGKVNKLDNCAYGERIRARIQGKKALSKLYNEFYSRYSDCIKKCPEKGLVLEIGSGAGLIKDAIPNVVTTDILAYETVDLVMDAAEFPFCDNSLRSIFLLNTLHHLPDSKAFFSEVVRCLMPGGRVLIIDQYHGWFSKIIYTYLHHESYEPGAVNWNFKTSGPLSGANGALCWIIFYRDRHLFEKNCPFHSNLFLRA